MVDDTVLEELVREAAEAISVPVGGRERVLAERDRRHPRSGGARSPIGRLKSWRRRRPVLSVASAIAAILLVAGVITNLGLSGGNTLHKSSSSAASPIKGSSTGSSASARPGTFGVNPTSSAAAGPLGPPEQGPAKAATPSQGPTLPILVPQSQAKVVKTGSAAIQVASGNVDTTLGTLTTDAVADGGFVASTAESQSQGGGAAGDVTLRVPVSAFETLVNQVRKVGTLTSLNTSGQDVTSQYVDLQARIQSLQDTRTQFEQILARAQAIGDILSVEQQISDLQTQIEQLQGQQRVLEDQTTYSTLSVHVTEATKKAVAVPPPPSGLTKAWNHARHSFSHGIESVLAATGGIAVFLLFATILLLLAKLVWVKVVQRLV